MESSIIVSPKFQVVIPKWVRQALGIQKGQKLEVFVEGNRVELVPVQKMETLFGRFPGLRKGPSMREIREAWKEHV